MDRSFVASSRTLLLTMIVLLLQVSCGASKGTETSETMTVAARDPRALLGCLDASLPDPPSEPPPSFGLVLLNEPRAISGRARTSRTREAPAPRRDAVAMRILLLSATSDDDVEPSAALARQALQSWGVPYDHVVLTRNGLRRSEGPLKLVDAEGRGKYYGVVVATGQLTFQSKHGSWLSALNDEQWQELEAYERTFGIRRVSLFTYPNEALGVSLKGDAGGEKTSLRLGSSPLLQGTGLKPNAELPLEHAWVYRASLAASGRATSVVTYAPRDGSASDERDQAAVVTRYHDNREQLHFFFAQSIYSTPSVALANFWMSWMTRGVYLGKRRILLSAQIDDMFKWTTLWDSVSHSSQHDITHSYRIQPDDLDLFGDWQEDFRKRLPPGSDFRAEFAFNGVSVFESNGSVTEGEVLGYGSDPLFKRARERIGDFYWVSHTFTHPNLDAFTFQQASWEIEANQDFASDMFRGHDLVFSPRSIVTPQITGLLSGEVLRAFRNHGINAGIGDNSRDELRPANAYDAVWTNELLNGFEGFLVVPRHATTVYYNASTPEILESEYNDLYRGHWGKDLTLDEILALEADRTAPHLLAYRHDPYMFHQANLASFWWKDPVTGARQRHSLLSLWVETVTKRLRRYVELPIRTLKFDDLAKSYEERMTYERCGVESWLLREAGRPYALRLRTRNDCRIPVTGLTTSRGGFARESYGPDVTTYVEMSRGASREIFVERSENHAPL